MGEHKVIINSNNVHRLLITAILISSKWVDDILPNNSYFALLGGISLKEINKYEILMCSLLDFHFYVSVEDFNSYYNRIMIAGDALNFTMQRERVLSAAAA